MVNLELQSGAVVPLSLNFGALYRLRKCDKEAHLRYAYAINHMDSKDEDKVFLIIDIIYTAYLCAAIKDGTWEKTVDYQEFLDELPEDMSEIMTIGAELIRPKKKTASEKLLSEAQGDDGSEDTRSHIS